MAKLSTLVIIRPNAIEDNNIGNIISRFEHEGLNVIALKMITFTKEQVEGFYIEHMERSRFASLVASMISGAVILLVLRGDNAVVRVRKIVGNADPAVAESNTLRKLYSRSMIANAVHASESETSAEREVAYFFPKLY